MLDDGVVTGSFEQSVLHDGNPRPRLPPAVEIGSTSWYQQFKVPVVACRLVVRQATALNVGDQEDPVLDMWWSAPEDRLVFDNGVTITCAHPNLEVIATDEVVSFRKLKRWKFLGMESEGPWEDD